MYVYMYVCTVCMYVCMYIWLKVNIFFLLVEFFNLLSMKPVFNSDGEYCYVLGVQYEYSHSSKHAEYMQLVDDLLSILPNILI